MIIKALILPPPPPITDDFAVKKRFSLSKLVLALMLCYGAAAELPDMAFAGETGALVNLDKTDFAVGDYITVSTGHAISNDQQHQTAGDPDSSSQTIGSVDEHVSIDIAATGMDSAIYSYSSGKQIFNLNLGTIDSKTTAIDNSRYGNSGTGSQIFNGNIGKIIVRDITYKTQGISNTGFGHQEINGHVGSIQIDGNSYTSQNAGVYQYGTGNVGSATQYIQSIGDIGSASGRFGTGIYSYQGADQTIGSTGNLYAGLYGIYHFGDVGGQTISQVGSINVVAKNVIGAGIFGQTNTGQGFGAKQYIGMNGNITTTNAYGIRNAGGLQEIEALLPGGITIHSDQNNGKAVYALALSPSARNDKGEAIADTTLKGSFNVEGSVYVAFGANFPGRDQSKGNNSILRLKGRDYSIVTPGENGLPDKIENALDNTMILHGRGATFFVMKGSVLDLDEKGYNIVVGQSRMATNTRTGQRKDMSNIDVQGIYRGNGTFIYQADADIPAVSGSSPSAATLKQGAILLKTVTKSESGQQSQVNVQYGKTGEFSSDDIQSKDDAFSLLKGTANRVYVNEGIENIGGGKLAAGKAYMPEGLVHSWHADYYFDETGKVSPDGLLSQNDYAWQGTIDAVQDGETSTMTGVDSSAMVNYFAWRQEIETLSQRLGDVRAYPGQKGGWARVFSAQNKYDKGNHYFRNDYWSLQLGYDRPVGDGGWIMGGALSYTAGDSNLRNGGSADNWMLTGALYGTWHNQDGDYLDLIGKLSGMHNKYKVISDDNSFTTKASNSNWAYSISAEYGKRFQEKTYGYFVEPQIQLTLGRIEGSDYRTNNGIQVGQDSIDSVIGRVGLAFGRKLEKGSYFVRVDGLREFNGKGGAIFQETGGTPNRSRIDFRDTWGEVSLGGTWKLDEKSFGYAQLKRSFSADIQTEYRVDVGYRHIFD